MCGFCDGGKPVEAHGDRNERPSVKPYAQSFSDDGWCRPVKVVRCPSCDTVVPPFTRWRYCPGCGARFDWEGGEGENVRERIVRCRDCEHAYEIDGADEMNCLYFSEWDYRNDCPGEWRVEPDCFCAWGEERGDDRD